MKILKFAKAVQIDPTSGLPESKAAPKPQTRKGVQFTASTLHRDAAKTAAAEPGSGKWWSAVYAHMGDKTRPAPARPAANDKALWAGTPNFHNMQPAKMFGPGGRIIPNHDLMRYDFLTSLGFKHPDRM